MSSLRVHRTVLVVDGDSRLAGEIAAHLGQYGVAAKVASDGYEAVRAVQMRAYDLIVLGMQLRDRDGAEVLRLLRLDPHTAATPVHLLAAHGESEILNAALRVGAQGVFRRDELPAQSIAYEVATLVGGPVDVGNHAAVPRVPQQRTDPLSSVPAEVDAIARRFRSGGVSASSPPHVQARGPVPGMASREAPAPDSESNASAPPSNAPPATSGPSAVGDALRYSPSDHGFPGRGAIGAAPPPGHAPAAAAQAPSPSPPRAPVQAAAASIYSYDTALRADVGHGPYLAEAVGLRPDLVCSACGNPVTLRLWPDGERPLGVRGYFFCSRCDPQ